MFVQRVKLPETHNFVVVQRFCLFSSTSMVYQQTKLFVQRPPGTVCRRDGWFHRYSGGMYRVAAQRGYWGVDGSK